MKLKLVTAIAISAMAILSCSEDTGTIGTSLTYESDLLDLEADIFKAYSRSVAADSVYVRDFDSYIGIVKDPETNSYVKSEFMTQFNMLENYPLPDKNKLVMKPGDSIQADTCEIWLYFNKSKCYGDTLTPVKINLLELSKPMSETKTYYSNYDPVAEGYIRTDGLKKSISFTLNNLTYKDSVRNLTSYTEKARIPLNQAYTDKNGKTYSNYGNYILYNYYEHPEYFKNSYSFVNNICPGFFFQMVDGLGVMAMFSQIELRFSYKYHLKDDSKDYKSMMIMSSTKEVLKTTKLTNDKESLNKLIEDPTCTYIKSPAGIFTEVTLPIDDIKYVHPHDSLLSVSISFNRINSPVADNDYLLKSPTTLLMVPKDSLYTFFENKRNYDNRATYAASLLSNTYTFNNISGVVSRMASAKSVGSLIDPDWCNKHPNWNKVLLVPVTATSTTTTSSTVVSSVTNQIELSTTQLVGGENSPIEVKVVYARFVDQ